MSAVRYRLPDVMDLRAAAPLARDLLALRGKDVALDGSGVQRLGGLCLQVLLAARQTWAADDMPLLIVEPTATLRDCIHLFGATFHAPAYG